MNKKQNIGRLRADLRAAFGAPVSQKPGNDLQALRAALRGDELPPRSLAKVRAVIVSEGEYGAKEVGAGLEVVRESTGSRVVRVREVVCARSEFPLN
jgi:hypothetical protein